MKDKDFVMAYDHNAQIRDQFTRQAVPFAAAAEIRREDALGRIVDAADAGPSDTVLDVACGPGLLACAFARVTQHVTGIDLTPRMLEQALVLQQRLGLQNLTWHRGDVEQLPYPDASFSIVCSRFAFHHFLDPLTVLKEMRRVCRPGGQVVVADSAPAVDKAEAFNRMERLRDPSHVRALPLEELEALFAAAELPAPAIRRDNLRYELESLLARSFPKPGDADRIRQLFEESIVSDSLGVGAVRDDGTIRFLFPTAIVSARRVDRPTGDQ
jgi:ubiquinone/menaquinone biosynthesis C-methylase UbiE